MGSGRTALIALGLVLLALTLGLLGVAFVKFILWVQLAHPQLGVLLVLALLAWGFGSLILLLSTPKISLEKKKDEPNNQ